MTQRDKDLNIKVTPAVEDAFHFLYGVNKEDADITEEQIRCGQRLQQNYSRTERLEAIHAAYQMLDNIDQYGTPCAEWT